MDDPTGDPVVALFNDIRRQIKNDAAALKDAKANVILEPQRPDEDRGEVLANLTLAYRHLEDASMRMGKAIQARDGGVSVYDRSTTVGA